MVSHGAPTLLDSMAMAGTTNTAATSIGHSNRCSKRTARSFTSEGFDAVAADPTGRC